MRRVFIPNRGEIAVRIVSACRDARPRVRGRLLRGRPRRDGGAHGRPGRVHRPGPAGESYLRDDIVVQAALGTGCDAIHPGYGFLSESPRLAARAREHDLVFVGPPTEAIELAGDKLAARAEAERAGVPVLPGGEVSSIAQARSAGRRDRLPGAGQGRRGRRGAGDQARARRRASSSRCWGWPAARPASAFADDRMYVERLMESARHVEVQIAADEHGAVVHLGERDCSVQRRFQKVIEEAPAPALPEADARRAARGGGGVRRRDRLPQPGHGRVRGRCDRRRALLPRGQLPDPGRASGHRGRHRPRPGGAAAPDRRRRGRWASPGRRRRSPGTPSNAGSTPRTSPAGSCPRRARCRCSRSPSARDCGSTRTASRRRVPPYYDSLLAKLIAHGETRDQAIEILLDALEDVDVEGVETNRALLIARPRPSRVPRRRCDHRLAGAGDLMSAPIEFVDTTTRDGNQSLWSATGLTTPDVLAIAPTLDRVGYHALDFTSSTHMAVSVRFHQRGSVGADPAGQRGDAGHAAGDDHHRDALHLLGAGRRGGDAALLPAGGPQRAAPAADRRPVQRPGAAQADRRDGQGRGDRGGGDRAHLLDQPGPHHAYYAERAAALADCADMDRLYLKDPGGC